MKVRFLGVLLFIVICAILIGVIGSFYFLQKKIKPSSDTKPSIVLPRLEGAIDPTYTTNKFNFPKTINFQHLIFQNNKITAQSATFLSTTCQNVTGEFDAEAALLTCQYQQQEVQFYIKGGAFQLVHSQLQITGELDDQTVVGEAIYNGQTYRFEQQAGRALEVYTNTLSGALPCPNQPVQFYAQQLQIGAVAIPQPQLFFQLLEGGDKAVKFGTGIGLSGEFQANRGQKAVGKAYLRRYPLVYPLAGTVYATAVLEAALTNCPSITTLQQASGVMNIELENFRIHNLNLPQLAQDVTQTLSVEALTNGTYMQGVTDFGAVETTAYWQNQTLVLPETAAMFQGGNVILAGKLLPFEQTVDVTISIRFQTLPPETPTLNLTIKGNLQQPSIGLADQAFVKFMAGRKLRGLFGG